MVSPTIVHINFSLEPGGSENLLIDIANEQAKLAKVCIIIVNNRYSTSLLSNIDRKVRVYRLNRKPGQQWPVRCLLRLWSLLAWIRPTVIHCHNHAVIRLLAGFGTRTVLTAHCLGIGPEHLRKYKRVYAISAAVADDIRERTGVVPTVVLNGIPFSAVTRKSNYRADGRTPIRIVQIGRLVHAIKGQDLLLFALQKLLSDPQYLNITVDFIGTGQSRQYLEQLVSRLSLQPYVNFLGERPRQWIYQHLAGYDLLVQPSLSEGFGLTILEGIAAGLPIIASDHAGPREILQFMPGAALFEPGSVEGLEAAIKNFIDRFREHRIQSQCEVSRHLADRLYSLQNTALAYLRHYASHQ